MAVMDRAAVRSLRIRLLVPLSLVGGVVAVGTLGYYWLWRGVGGTWMDALFMTVTTITTIGYGEVKPLDTWGRLFTMVLAVTGIGSLFYTLGVVMEYLSAGAEQRGFRTGTSSPRGARCRGAETRCCPRG